MALITIGVLLVVYQGHVFWLYSFVVTSAIPLYVGQSITDFNLDKYYCERIEKYSSEWIALFRVNASSFLTTVNFEQNPLWSDTRSQL